MLYLCPIINEISKKMGRTQVYTEMENSCGNGKIDRSRFDIVCRYSAFSDCWFVKTKIALKGQGIKPFFNTGEYKVTNKAFEKLEAKYKVLQEMLLD